MFKMIVLPNNKNNKLISYDYITNYINYFNINCTSDIRINELTITGKIIETYEDNKNKYKILITNLFISVCSKNKHNNEVFLNWLDNCLIHNKTSYNIIIYNDKILYDKDSYQIFYVNKYDKNKLYCHSV